MRCSSSRTSNPAAASTMAVVGRDWNIVIAHVGAAPRARKSRPSPHVRIRRSAQILLFAHATAAKPCAIGNFEKTGRQETGHDGEHGPDGIAARERLARGGLV